MLLALPQLIIESKPSQYICNKYIFFLNVKLCVFLSHLQTLGMKFEFFQLGGEVVF